MYDLKNNIIYILLIDYNQICGSSGQKKKTTASLPMKKVRCTHGSAIGTMPIPPAFTGPLNTLETIR